MIPTLVNGVIHVWKPRPGLDPTVGLKALQIGAAAYGMALMAKKPEDIAQQEAERRLYEAVFGIRY